MKRNYCICLLMLGALVAASTSSCENEKIGNSPSGQNDVAANAQPVANKTVQKTGSESNSNAGKASTLPDATSESADFEGTAGVTDKKFQIKKAAILEDVRVGRHEAFDRVVFEFEDAELPSYHIEYIDKPVRACGSGDVVPLAGDGWLEIRFTPAAAHSEDGEPTIKNRAQAPNLQIIKEMKSTCDFEADVEWVLGVAAPNKYRVLELKNPTRLAVDIKH